MSKKIKLFLTLLCTVLIAVTIYLKFIKQNKIEIPKITLSGKNIITIYEGNNYKEPGYKATDPSDGDITNKVKIKGKTLFLYDGTLYKQIPTTNGIQYEVYGFIDE